MELREIEFGKVLGASGVQGFFGEGYWYHRYLRRIGLDFSGATFVAKTTTLQPREGNMPLRDDYTPADRLPRCIVVKPIKGIALNAVGLSGPGAEALFADGRWQARREPILISFMSVAGTADERISELACFLRILERELPGFRSPIGLQINYSCPNVGLHVGGLIEEVTAGLDMASRLGIPLMPKFNVQIPVGTALQISRHEACDGLCISNTVPWGALLERIDWKRLFGSDVSPLADLGGGGLSGKPLLPLLFEWLDGARSLGINKPINAGGGILSLRDAREVMRRGAASIFLGSIVFLRPWRVRRIIRAINSD